MAWCLVKHRDNFTFISITSLGVTHYDSSDLMNSIVFAEPIITFQKSPLI
jgi:hypothetical protein